VKAILSPKTEVERKENPAAFERCNLPRDFNLREIFHNLSAVVDRITAFILDAT
jgi:hypothetical protein